MRISVPDGPHAADLFPRLLEGWRDSDLGRSDQPGELPEVRLPALTADSFEHVASRLSVQVTTAALDYHRGSHLLLHAGGVAGTDGSVIAIVGPSGRGKTTTVRQLARTLGYVSDETIAITADDRVLPYRKPLSVIAEGHAQKLQVAPSKLALRSLPEAPLRIAGLVLLERGDRTDSRMEPVPLAEGIVELVQQTSYLVELPHPLRRIAEIAQTTGGIRRLRAGEPERIADVADRLFENGACEPWEHVMPGVGDTAHSVADVVDAVECADGTVVLTRDRRVQVLSGVASLVWRGICAGDDGVALEARVEEVAGAPPAESLHDAVQGVCEGLVLAGILSAWGSA